ncbi:CLUMA_CG016197_ isoform A [Caligus rogercresseyi]|uniref:ER membrane protein complex subunit 1 n=1 Tax=Caligus rogercresseyi TaxID=217165 RepID=A0A7T8KGI9_CALRO|nr:CLUMA_CG016197_ isoform A [Caligus rogercresseyi]
MRSLTPVLLLLLSGTGHCLYEDQAFKMDWVHENLDKAFSGVPLPDGSLVTLSHSGQLGRISSRGKLLWRQGFESGARFLDLDERSGEIRTLSSRSPGVIQLRVWNPEDGSLLKEELAQVGGADFEQAFLLKDKVILLLRDAIKSLDWSTSPEGTLKDYPIPFSSEERICKRVKSLLLYCTNPQGVYMGYFDMQRLSSGWKSQHIENDFNLMNSFQKAEGPLSMKYGFLSYPQGDSSSRQSVLHPCSSSEFIDLSMMCSGEKCSVSLASETRVFHHYRGDIEDFWMLCDDRSGDKNAIFLFQDGSLVGNGWIRNDGLGALSQTQILPYISEESMASRGQGGSSASPGILLRFAERLARHGFLLKYKLENMFHREVNDFGIRKVIVSVSKYGKIYGLDSKNGKILWQIISFSLILRSEGNPLCACLYKNALGTHIVTFNTMSGSVTSERTFSGPVSQAFSLHFHLQEDIRPMLILMENGEIEMEPPSQDKKMELEINKKKTYVLSLASKNTIVGNRVVMEGGKIKMDKLWDVVVSGVMADRSVLFKYVNPNLVAVFAESVEGGSFSLLLLDMRVSGPFSLVHSENWIVYSYYNEKSRRTELGSLELFEGKTQVNGSLFSSFQNTLAPFIERQSYILGGGGHVLALGDTTTEKAITSKYLLLASSQGVVYNVPRSILDPRRPNMNTPLDMREPGLLPYIPELHLSPETALNYNRTLLGPKKIITSHTGLESTSVVFLQGIDIYCTQVHPSKGFDLLKDDFDYYVISSVCMGLVIAAYVTKKLAMNKNVKQAWK